MASSQDTEITLGTAKLLGIFFGLVMICAVFFALGYTLGRKSESGLPSAATLGLVPAANGAKPASSAAGSSSAPMTFYKAVEQQNANPQLTPTDATAAPPATDASAEKSTASSTATSPDATQAANLPDPMAPIPGTGYFVQVAAVSKQDDADALVDALKKKQYPAFVANTSTSDKLYRVQTGPFGDIKEAEAMRARLINDGYNPILKK
ncbi:MAG: SPOR domain-containing protein [Candidatus Sulfotelmatobacter sp.]